MLLRVGMSRYASVRVLTRLYFPRLKRKIVKNGIKRVESSRIGFSSKRIEFDPDKRVFEFSKIFNEIATRV